MSYHMCMIHDIIHIWTPKAPYVFCPCTLHPHDCLLADINTMYFKIPFIKTILCSMRELFNYNSKSHVIYIFLTI